MGVKCVIIRKWWVTQCLLPEVRSNEANKHQNNTRVSTETVRHQSIYIYIYIIQFPTRHNESMNYDKTAIFTHRSRVSFARVSFCWWRHNRLPMTSQWPDNCDAITWILLSNSLYIDFIHGDDGRSCKKCTYSNYANQHMYAILTTLLYKRTGVVLI